MVIAALNYCQNYEFHDSSYLIAIKANNKITGNFRGNTVSSSSDS